MYALMTQEIIKACTICQSQKFLDEFNKRTSSKDGYQNVCRECNSKRNKLHYERNKEKVLARTLASKKIGKAILRDYICTYLETHVCVCCGESDIRCLEFDHLKDKSCNISDILTNVGTLDKLKIEIDKCQVLCANCHRKKTATDFNWYKSRGVVQRQDKGL